jgi:hypothetical protein
VNNVEALNDFKQMLKEIHPFVVLSDRDDMLLGMAINHAYLILGSEREKLVQRIEKLETGMKQAKHIMETHPNLYDALEEGTYHITQALRMGDDDE